MMQQLHRSRHAQRTASQVPALLLILCCATVLSAADDGAAPPLIEYRQTGERGLIFVNNPEIVLAGDLVEEGMAIYLETLPAGLWRSWCEHRNATTGPLQHGVLLRNPGETALEVTVEAAATGAFGEVFVDAWNEPTTSTVTIAPGGWHWLIRGDAKKGTFYGSLVDLRCDGPSELLHVAGRNLDGLEPADLRYLGYVTREHGKRHREARVYKGRNPHSVAELELHFTIDDADQGVLPVRRRPFDPETQSYGEAVPCLKGWRSNICIGHEQDAVMSDMFSFQDPGLQTPFDPRRRSDALDMFPNVGNWAVLYHHHGSITNTGSRSRRVALRLAGGGLNLAYQPEPAAPWQAERVGGTLDWCVFTVEPGATARFDARWILGGPANGNVVQSVVLLDE